MATQQELFLELAQPDEKGISRWVNTSTEFFDISPIEIIKEKNTNEK